ncbi:MAG: hypothetical protein EOP61_10125 [Sphingomonadales bacterium]|nr:MAG: hypothetical protein EOP61_10125 [Sphingomonadales bacterium]
MLYHVSTDAQNPQRVASVIAQLWDGVATPFPAVIEGSWIAMAGDARNSAIEFYPAGTVLVQGEGEAGGHGEIRSHRGGSPMHFAMATQKSIPEVRAIAQSHGWPAKVCSRGDAFHVIELWLEGTHMIEVLTPEMQAEYLAAFTVKNWQGFLAQHAMAAAA